MQKAHERTFYGSSARTIKQSYKRTKHNVYEKK